MVERQIKPKLITQIGIAILRKSHSDIGKPSNYQIKTHNTDLTTTATYRNSDTNSDIPIRTEKEKFDKYNLKAIQLHKNVLQIKNEFQEGQKIPLSPDTAKAKRNLEIEKDKIKDKNNKKPKDISKINTNTKSSEVIADDENQSEGIGRRRSENRSGTIRENAPALPMEYSPNMSPDIKKRLSRINTNSHSIDNVRGKSILKVKKLRRTDTFNDIGTSNRSVKKGKRVQFHRVKSIINYNPNNAIKRKNTNTYDKKD